MDLGSSYALRRVLHGLGMYLALVLALSAVFNRVADASLRSLVEEETVQALRTAGNLRPADYEALRAETLRAGLARHHLDDPWIARVLYGARDVLLLDFGRAGSLRTATGESSVSALLLEALPNTLLLFGTEALLVMAFGALLGLLAASRRGGLLDRALSFVPMILKGLPSWWIGMLALAAFAYALPLFPAGGIHVNPAPGGFAGLLDLLWHLMLPLLVLVLLNLWGFALEVRNLVAGLVDSPWIRAARGRGLPESSILFRHVLAGARPALLTLLVTGLLQSLTGNLLIEGIFGWPGLGNLYFVAVQRSDVPVLLGILSVQTFLNLAGLVGLDLAYRRLDPRVAARENAAREGAGASR